jgi:hypothetical protein
MIKRVLGLFLLFSLSFSNAWGQLNVSFTTNPPVVNGQINICLGQKIIFTNTSTGTTSSSIYQWVFGGGSPNTANSSGPHEILYNSAGTYTTSLTINSTTTSVTVNVGTSPGPIATLQLNNPPSNYSSINYNGQIIFRRCQSSITNGNFPFIDPNQSSYPAGTLQTINWGDGQTNNYTTPHSTNISHNYTTLGSFNLTFTVTYPNGCVAVTNYTVFVGSNPPVISITGSGSETCIPGAYSFVVGGQDQQGTNYEIIYNDGSPSLNFSNYLSIPNPINHTFNTISCGTFSSVNNNIFPNAYSIQAYAKNGCNPAGSYAALGPIYVSESVTPSFNTNPNNTVCLNTTVTFTNTTTGGINASSSGCSPDNKFYWEVSPNSGFTLQNNTTLGSPNGFMDKWLK